MVKKEQRVFRIDFVPKQQDGEDDTEFEIRKVSGTGSGFVKARSLAGARRQRRLGGFTKKRFKIRTTKLSKKRSRTLGILVKQF